MHAFLAAIWPFSALAVEPCGATEVDVSGLVGLSMLEWLDQPGRDCADALDRTAD